MNDLGLQPDEEEPEGVGPPEHVRRLDPDRRVTTAALLKDALVDDDDPRFPRWLPLPGVILAIGWAGLTASTAGADFAHAILWPGAGIFALTTVATWLGWQLELE
ncbi:MAG: hypothetical protein WCQ48_05685 [Chloroflexota bacterium]